MRTANKGTKEQSRSACERLIGIRRLLKFLSNKSILAPIMSCWSRATNERYTQDEYLERPKEMTDWRHVLTISAFIVWAYLMVSQR